LAVEHAQVSCQNAARRDRQVLAGTSASELTGIVILR
jgi:hypothetical protein